MTERANVLLIAPLPPKERKLREDAPMGLAYIASALERNMHEVAIFDMGIEPNRLLMQQIEASQPSIIGIQVMTQHRLFVFELAREIKTKFPSATIVLGGPHVMFTADELLRKISSVDIVVRGEGETTMCELASGAALADIHGISFREEGKVIHNPARPLEKLDDLPPPAYHLLNLRKYDLRVDSEPAIPIFTSRGCPHKCIFCSAGRMWGGIRFHRPDQVIRQIEYIKNSLGYNAFVIEDDAFGINTRIAREILDGIKDLGVRFAIKSRVDILSKEFLGLLKEAGCVRANFGVESGEPRVLRAIKKGGKLYNVVEVVECCRELDIVPGCYFMAGNMTETREDVITTARFAKRLVKLGAIPIWAWGVLVFPGTELDSLAREYGLFPKDFSWTESYHNEKNKLLGYVPYTPVLENGHLSIEDLVELRKEGLIIIDGHVLYYINHIGRKVIPPRIRQLKITHNIHEKLTTLLR